MKQIVVELQDYMGTDRQIAESAWTSSFDKTVRDYKTEEQVMNLVKRLATEGHSTPFESVVLRFWLRIPIFVDRQHMTHRIASHNGLSGRYRTMPTDYYELPEDVNNIILKATDGCILQNLYQDSCNLAVENYQNSIKILKMSEKNGRITNEEYKRAREILRGQLPVAGMTERTTIMNLRSFANYYKLRSANSAQKEIQEVANLMLRSIKEANVCPIAIEALEQNNWEI